MPCQVFIFELHQTLGGVSVDSGFTEQFVSLYAASEGVIPRGQVAVIFRVDIRSSGDQQSEDLRVEWCETSHIGVRVPCVGVDAFFSSMRTTSGFRW